MILRPDYRLYKRGAPLVRNKQMIEMADKIFAFWDGKSAGTKYTINFAKSINKDVTVLLSVYKII